MTRESGFFRQSAGFRVGALVRRLTGGEAINALGTDLDRLLDEVTGINGGGGSEGDSFVGFHDRNDEE